MNIPAILENNKSVDLITGCWNWKLGKTGNGYGVIKFKEVVWYVHRLVAFLELGLESFEDKRLVLHKCDNPSCFNPNHLYLGDYKQNVSDMMARGRMVKVNRDKTHCSSGHEFTPENTYITIRKETGNKRRQCRKCRIEADKSRRRFLKSA